MHFYYHVFILFIGEISKISSENTTTDNNLERNSRKAQFNQDNWNWGPASRPNQGLSVQNQGFQGQHQGQQFGNIHGGGGHHHGGHHGGQQQHHNPQSDWSFGVQEPFGHQQHGGHGGGGHHHGGHNEGGWRPRRPSGRPPPPPGYSGYRPEGWGHGGYSYDSYGEKERRVSQIRFEEYMSKIYGNNYTEENSILTPEELHGRVIAAPGEFRHMAVIGIRSEDRTKEWKCGGSLIDVNFVLTAAHCTDFGGQPPTNVKIGDINLRVREDTVATQRMKIEQIYVHPKYKSNVLYYDIALLRLSKPAVFTRHVRPARLWSSMDIPYEKVFAMGYGATTFGKAPTDVLTYFNLTLIGTQQCNKALPAIEDASDGIVDSQICAMDTQGDSDTCQGDSGGPLQLHLPGRRRTRYYIIGITSYGLFCGSKTPSVYTRVYSFLDWIEGIVWPEEQNKK